MSDQTILSEGAPATNAPLTERRAAVRHLCNREAQVNIQKMPAITFPAAHLRNVSSLGIGLLLSSPVWMGTVLQVKVQGKEWVQTLVGRVVQVTNRPNGWLHGCELTAPSVMPTCRISCSDLCGRYPLNHTGREERPIEIDKLADFSLTSCPSLDRKLGTSTHTLAKHSLTRPMASCPSPSFIESSSDFPGSSD